MAGSVATHRALRTCVRSWSRRLGPYLLLAGSMMFGVPALGVALGELARPDDAGADLRHERGPVRRAHGVSMTASRVGRARVTPEMVPST